MEKLTQKQKLVLSGFTGTLCTKFSDFHEDVEKRLNRPVFTHQFPELEDTIQEAYREDFLSML